MMGARWMNTRVIFGALLVCCCILLTQLSPGTYYTMLKSKVTCLFEKSAGKVQNCTEMLTPTELETNRSYVVADASTTASKNRSDATTTASKQATMQHRQQAFKERCKQLYGDDHHLSNNANFDRGHLIFNDKYKLVYCYIPKVACTNMQRIFLILTGKIQQTDPMNISSRQVHGVYKRKYLSILNQLKNETAVMDRLKNYRKIIFVRNPFERVLSMYRATLGAKGPNGFKTNDGRTIIRKFRKNPSKESLQKGHDVSLPEFIQYLAYLNDKVKNLRNEHWQKYTRLCHPCRIDYDFIGNYETLTEDVEYLLNEIGVGDSLRFPPRRELYKATKTVDVLANHYKDVPKDLIKKIRDIYADDFFLFDFKIPSAVQRLLEDG